MKETVLVVGSDNESNLLLNELLSTSGFEVTNAFDIFEAGKRIAEKQPDLVIADIDFVPDIPLSLMQKKGEGNDVVPSDLIVLAPWSDKERIIPFLKHAANYVFKPIDIPDLLLFRINQTLAHRELIKKTHLLISQLRECATKDPLTGLYNYRHLNYRLSEEIMRSRRYRHPLCLLLFDIDAFKQINQKFGHICGNYLLTKVGEILRDNVRKVDTVFRYGSDQFLVLMPETEKCHVVGIAMRLIIKIREHPFNYEGYTFKITMSVGCAAYPDKAKDMHELLTSAESAVSRAKKLGGDMLFFE